MNRRAQSTIEYMVLVGIIVAGLVGMQLYTKRSLQGRMREHSLQITEEVYSPQATLSHLETNTVMNESTTTTRNDVQTNTQQILRTTNSWEDTLSFAEEHLRW